MPSPAAATATAAHRRDLAGVVRLVTRRLRLVTNTAPVDDVDAWWDRRGPELEAITRTGATATATLATRYLRTHAALEGRNITPERVVVDAAQIATSLHVTGPVAFKTHVAATGSPEAARLVMADRLRGSAQRLTLAGDRLTTMGTILANPRDIAGYRRVTSGSPCSFCAMLASRGGVYGAARSAGFQAHDSCACTPEPLYEVEPEPASVQRLRAEWEAATRGLSGAEALAAFRRARAATS